MSGAMALAIGGYSDGLGLLLSALLSEAVPSAPPRPQRPPAKRGTASTGTPAKQLGRAHKAHLVKGLRP